MIPVAVVVLYGALACATVVPTSVVGTTVGSPSQQPAKPNLPVICKQLNELGVQSHPSLNPQPGPKPK